MLSNYIAALIALVNVLLLAYGNLSWGFTVWALLLIGVSICWLVVDFFGDDPEWPEDHDDLGDLK